MRRSVPPHFWRALVDPLRKAIDVGLRPRPPYGHVTRNYLIKSQASQDFPGGAPNIGPTVERKHELHACRIARREQANYALDKTNVTLHSVCHDLPYVCLELRSAASVVIAAWELPENI
jgi:hypothetical protein